jgi:hypothetical protein
MLVNRTLRLNEIVTRPDMQHVLQHAPDVLHLLRFAALQDDARDRWHLYEILKTLASLRVGYHAKHPELQASRCYEVVIQAIDALLPSEAGSQQESA